MQAALHADSSLPPLKKGNWENNKAMVLGKTGIQNLLMLLDTLSQLPHQEELVPTVKQTCEMGSISGFKQTL